MAFRELREFINLEYGNLHLAFTQWDRAKTSELSKARIISGLRTATFPNHHEWEARIQDFANSLFSLGEDMETVDFNTFFLHFHKGEVTFKTSPGTSPNRPASPRRPSPSKTPLSVDAPQSMYLTPTKPPPPPSAPSLPPTSSVNDRADRLREMLLALSCDIPTSSLSNTMQTGEEKITIAPSDVRRSLHLVDRTMPLAEVERVAFVLLGSSKSSMRQGLAPVLSRLSFLQKEGLY